MIQYHGTLIYFDIAVTGQGQMYHRLADQGRYGIGCDKFYLPDLVAHRRILVVGEYHPAAIL